MGTHRIKQLKDGWTILTADGKPSAHFEHNVALIDGKPELLSTFEYVYQALGIQRGRNSFSKPSFGLMKGLLELAPQTLAHLFEYLVSASN